MRIVVDIQGAQATNAHRGIGIYSLSLCDHLVEAARERGDEIVVAVNGAFAQVADALKHRFAPLQHVSVQVWFPPTMLHGHVADDGWLRDAASAIYEEFLGSLEPDVLLVTSLFEGFADAAVPVLPTRLSIPTAVVLYDLIPLALPRLYLEDSRYEDWYLARLGQLARATRLLSISEATRSETQRLLDVPPQSITTIGAAASSIFTTGELTPDEIETLQRKFGISRPCALYTGGIDPRKNIDGLIQGFAHLDPSVRREHQLVIVCAVSDDDRRHLSLAARACGLDEDEVVLTGFVEETDLVSLYRLAKVAVFPSLHEGFGLPALEAMCCGRAVIASDRSSLPEVVGRADALFDPTSSTSIGEMLGKALTDDAFRSDLEQHAVNQASLFTWQGTARRTLEALHEIANPTNSVAQPEPPLATAPRPSLAVLSPIPPEASGISEYTALLLPFLGRYYELTVITDVPQIDDAWTRANASIRTTSWFKQHGHHFDRVLYNFGNSSFHGHMFDLAAEIPGVVVLHDFALSGIVSYRDSTGESPRSWSRSLVHSHGFAALAADCASTDRSSTIWSFPVNLGVLQQALGVIVHSEQARDLANSWYGPGSSARWRVVPMPRSSSDLPPRPAARDRLGVSDDTMLVCSFGMVGPAKLIDSLLEAWASSTLGSSRTAQLVLVGENHDPGYEERLSSLVEQLGLTNVTFTGRVDRSAYVDYLAAADIGVQLRTKSRGETSASAFDCLSAGLATVVNSNGSLGELPDHTVLKVEDQFRIEDLRNAIERFASDPALRAQYGSSARGFVLDHHRPSQSAAAIRAALESFWQRPLNHRPVIGRAIAETAGPPSGSAELRSASEAAIRSLRVVPRQRHLFVDVSELVQRDIGSGIQRVTRNLARFLLSSQQDGLRVELVAATETTGYRCVRKFASSLLGLDVEVPDVDFDPAPGDLFLGLDLQPFVVQAHRQTFRDLRLNGVHVAFVVYDLLPIQAPEYFLPGAFEAHSAWLDVVAEADALLSISRSVRNDLEVWLAHRHQGASMPELGWFHLGAELDGINPSIRRPQSATHHRFLMVGTLEPRKRHAQVLDAFELLWEQGVEVELHIVGRRGWLVDQLIERLSQHPRSGQQLVWLEDASDEELAAGYASSSALISASGGEGFGLPLIEAARYGLPIIARDLPVFREILGENAFYFSGNEAHDLAQALEQWLLAESRGDTIAPHEVEFQSWPDSAAQILQELQRLSGYGEEGILETTTTNVSGTNGETPR